MAHGQLTSVLRHIRQLIGSQAAAEQADGQLLHRFVRDRDETAFAALVERHGPMVLGVCRRILADAHDAEDVFQATFLVLVRKAAGMRQWGSLGNWLYTVAYHLALRTRAQGARRRAQEREVSDMPQATANGAWAELRPVLDAELRRLPDKYRAAVILCYLEGKTNEEAARELGCPTGTLKVRLMRARDLLRARLARRGLPLSAGLLAPALAEPASAAVTPLLYETTLRAATLFAAGNATAAGAVSGRAVLMAEGVLNTMFLTKLKAAAVVLLAIALMGTGAGALMSRTPSNEPAEEAAVSPAGGAVAAAPVEPPVLLGEKGKARDIRRKLRKDLMQTVTLDKGIDPNTPLKDALEFLSSEYSTTFIIDSKAFEAIGVQKVEDQPVALPRMKDVRLSTVLRLLLGQVKGDVYTGTYLLRPDYIEITTTYNQLVEALGDDPAAVFGDRSEPAPDEMAKSLPNPMASPLAPPELRRMTPMVQPDFEKRPLTETLQELATESGVDIVIDPRAAEKAKAVVSLTLYNTLLDTSVTLLTDMADLDWVWIDRVVYVTTPENAKAKREKARAVYEERSKALKRFLPPPKPQGGPPGM